MGLEHLSAMLEKSRLQRVADAKRFAELDVDLCQCCHAHGEDKRSLWVDCFYAISEVIPEAIEVSEVEPKPENHQRGYYFRICKSCRGRFLTMMNQWWNQGVYLRDAPKDHDGHLEEDYDDPERNIPIRVNGAIKMLTRAEWDAYEAEKTLK